ncbi:porin family protein [Hanstruepera marina]|uniref:porin family protein n=1 Tax=Hanstruepera marina TaxID=2873265 RepID=UPI001CA76D4C|nr:porin family protein [Hanstruepera marina]
MKHIFLLLVGILWFQQSMAQKEQDTISKIEDPRYLEDQFYAAITYNILGKKPNGLSQSGFSSGFHLGYIRDIPLNKNRNFGLGVGLGVSADSYNNNLLITKDSNGNYDYIILDEENIGYSKNKFTIYTVNLPIQIRWRTSTQSEYKFWRIYTGLNIEYVFATSSKYKGELGKIKNNNIKSISDFQYGLTISAGYNTWNIYFYYGLNPILGDINSSSNFSTDMNALKVGLIFYLL